MQKNILAINPGSTSTKFAVYQDNTMLFTETIRHDDEEMMKYRSIADQLPFRLQTILTSVKKHGFDVGMLDAVAGRGGLLKPMASGTYRIGKDLLDDAQSGKYGEHASNLGAILAFEIATYLGIPSFIVDPVGVDEFIAESRISGFSEIERMSQVHALNIKAVSRKIACKLDLHLEEANFVVAHLGGGISIAAHRKGKIIDVNNADNEGPFSPERSGTLPVKQLIELCYSGKYSKKELISLITRKGGIFSYLGTKSAVEAEERALAGEFQAQLVLNAMVHQICKEIGAMATVLEGKINGIILTGGLAHSEFLIDKIIKRIGFLGQIFVVPGEEELEALAAGTLRVLQGEESAKEYGGLGQITAH